MNQNRPIIFSLACVVCVLLTGFAGAQLEKEAKPKQAQAPAPIENNVLDDAQWKQVDQSVERGLAWLASQQKPDGSFPSLDAGQPGVSSFVLMAFIAKGKSPAVGKYSKTLIRAIDFIVSKQKSNGLIAALAPDAAPISRKRVQPNNYDSCAISYNHAISALALAEAYGQCDEAQAKKLTGVIKKAIAATGEMQDWEAPRRLEEGGWKYISDDPNDGSDLSATALQLMFLRSAKNAGFEVPKQSIDRAMVFIERCYNEKSDVFVYNPYLKNTESRAMAGAGVVAMSHGGKHQTKKAQKSGDWILTRDFTDYNADESINGWDWQPDRYHYGVFHCTQAMYLLGGKHWTQFFPPVVETLLANQQDDGSWPPEKYDKRYGNCYSTSLCVLSLSVPDQLLPIFQR